MDEYSKLEHIWISNPRVWQSEILLGLSVLHENLNLSNIWYTTTDSFYFGREIKITKQISNFVKRIWWEFLKIGRKYQAAGSSTVSDKNS